MTTLRLPLACPYCGAEVMPQLEYRPGSYSEHRDHVGYTCDGWTRCGAEWDASGFVTVPGAALEDKPWEPGDGYVI